MICNISCGEYSWDAGRGGIPGQAAGDVNVAVRIHLQLPVEQRGIGDVPNRDEDAVQFDVAEQVGRCGQQRADA